MKTKAEVMYSTMNPWRLFFVVALPGMISMFTMSIYSIVEGAFIGQVLGEGAFAAVNIAFPLVMINFSLADLIGVGASAPISIALGKGDHKTANNIFSCSVVMIFISSIIMGSIMFFAAEPLARLMGANDVLLETSVKYLRTYALTSPLTNIFFAMDNYLRISGYIKTSMFINISLNAMTIGLLTVFLLVVEMDVVGSALATSISMCICSVIAMIPFIRRKALLQFVKPKFNKAMFKEIAACGSPVFLSNIAGRLTSILLNISLMTLGVAALGEGGGTTAVAAYAVLMYSSDIGQPLVYGISDSMSPAIGYNYGAEQYDRVKRIAKCVFIGSCTVSVITTAIMFFFAHPVVSIFANAEDVRLVELSTHAIRIFCLAYIFRWISIAAQSFLSAIEKPFMATVLAVATVLVFPVIILGAFWNMGLDGIWLNMLGTSVLSGILSVWLLMRIGREIKRKEKQKQN
ncbi:MAG: MATE family efflux transporter [Ruminococcaceae bacterium]|nr:MATE family efflux transporter [Oscillospiraceae bacterium]